MRRETLSIGLLVLLLAIGGAYYGCVQIYRQAYYPRSVLLNEGLLEKLGIHDQCEYVLEGDLILPSFNPTYGTYECVLYFDKSNDAAIHARVEQIKSSLNQNGWDKTQAAGFYKKEIEAAKLTVVVSAGGLTLVDKMGKVRDGIIVQYRADLKE